MDAATDVNECAEECNALDTCNWFVYDSAGPACMLTEDRESISACTTCTYGHRGCIQEESSGTTTVQQSHIDTSESPFFLHALSSSRSVCKVECYQCFKLSGLTGTSQSFLALDSQW